MISPPTAWEIRAVLIEYLNTVTDLVAWFDANASELRIIEHQAGVTPKRLEVTIDVARVALRDLNSCPRYDVQFDLHVFDTGVNTREANYALGLLEQALIGEEALWRTGFWPSEYVVLRNILLDLRLSQSPQGEGWTVATAFKAIMRYE